MLRWASFLWLEDCIMHWRWCFGNAQTLDWYTTCVLTDFFVKIAHRSDWFFLWRLRWFLRWYLSCETCEKAVAIWGSQYIVAWRLKVMHKRSFFCCYERLILKPWWLLMLWVLWRMITEDCWWKIYSWRLTLWRSCCVKSFFSANWSCVSDLQGPWKLIIDVATIILENVDSHHHTIVWSVTALVEAILLLRVQWRPVTEGSRQSSSVWSCSYYAARIPRASNLRYAPLRWWEIVFY